MNLAINLTQQVDVIVIHRFEVRRQFRRRAVRNGALPSVMTGDHALVAIGAHSLDEAILDLR